MGVLQWAVYLLALLGVGRVCTAEKDVMVEYSVEDNTTRAIISDAQALQFFETFGWTEQGVGGAEKITAPDTYESLLTGFQEMYKLEVTGILDDATKELMSSPRCGVKDFGSGGYLGEGQSRRKRFTRTGTVWPRTTVTYYIEGGTQDLQPNVVESEIQSAFERWESVSALTLLEATNAASADIRITFVIREHGDGNSFDGRGGTLAHAYGPGNGIGGDTHFDDEETFMTGSNGINLHIVATHEFGHSLGLGHSTDSTAVMAPFYRYVPNFELMSDDIVGIQALYGPPPRQPPPVPATLPPPPPATTTTTQAPTTTPPPTYCNGQFDAVANSFDGGLYFFQGATVLKVNLIGIEWAIASGYPKYIWEEFPAVYTAYIDAAVLFRYSTGQKFLYIFNGDDYWRVSETNSIPDPQTANSPYPLRISMYWGGVPSNLDAAYFWTGNNYLYFFKGDQYWRYSFYLRGVDLGYPRSGLNWRDVQLPLADAFDFRGRTFFFGANGLYQQFNDAAFQAGNSFLIADTYLGCQTFNFGVEPTDAPVTCGMDSGSSTLVDNTASLLLLLLSTAVYVLKQI